MDSLQNPTKPDISKTEDVDFMSDLRYATLVDFKTLNGIITTPEGSIQKKSMQWLADQLEVHRDTLYAWMNRPGFWDNVNARRKEVAGKNRVSLIHEVLFLKARDGSFQHMQLWLANFDPNFRMPTEKHEIETGSGLADLINAARTQQLKERTIIDVSPVDQADA